jgi:hypothetical protein
MNATLTNRYTGRNTTLRLKPNNWVSSKNYRAALRRIASGPCTPVRSDASFTVYDSRGPCQIVQEHGRMSPLIAA